MRPPQDEDADEVAAFSNEECVAWLGTPVIDADWLRGRWTAPGVDRDLDFAVVDSPSGEVCGFLSVETEPPFTEVFALGIVAPAFHGLGLGAAIVSETERRGRRFEALADPSARVVIHAGVLAGEPRVSALLSFVVTVRCAASSSGASTSRVSRLPPRDVEGIAIRGFRPEEARRLYEAHIEAFGDHWGAGKETYEDSRHHQLDAPDFDAGLWFVAWDGDEVAGYIGAQKKSREDPSRGYIPVLGVRRPYRRRGLGEALLRTVFGALYALGSRGAELHVDADSVTGATRLYERVGMSAHPRFATWEKELQPGGALAR